MELILKINKALIYSSLFLTPVIFFKGTFENFEFPKLIFLLLILGFVSFSYFFFFFDKKDFSKEILFFGSAYAVSFLLSSHFYTSLFGYYTRFYGGIILVFVFFGVVLIFKKNIGEKGWGKFF